jgi:hypothetical protein
VVVPHHYRSRICICVQALSASPAAQLVGAEVTVSGKHVVVESLVAEGGFGSVYLVTVVGSEEHLILKKMFANGPELVAQLTEEVRLMEALSHPNVVRVLGSDVKKRGSESVEILVLMEWCPGGHMLARLNSLRESGRKLTWSKILEVFVQMVRPVAYMHSLSPPVAHRKCTTRSPALLLCSLFASVMIENITLVNCVLTRASPSFPCPLPRL